MIRIIILFYILCVAFIANAQSPVKWTFTSKKLSSTTYEIHLKATIDEPWHIYAQNSPKGGPLPTKITFSKNPLITLTGKIKEVGALDIYHDQTFDVDVYSYGGEVDFVQVVGLKVKSEKLKVKTNITGTVEFMACTKEQCLTPQKVKFDVRVE